MQPLEPDNEYVPATQEIQPDIAVLPMMILNVPAEQSEQLDDPVLA